ncbi:hypothetical protein [Algoriphagus sp.]|uniref:hypothetical protein n=1 Tax=Algoriphagus sp. TaxID=1872435 RepID=UPI00391B7A5E
MISGLPPGEKKGGLDYLLKFSKTPNLFRQSVNSQKAIFTPGSLFFTPITFDANSIGGQGEITKELLEYLETFVKFSLKINTIGLSKDFVDLLKFLKVYRIHLKIKCPTIDQEFHPVGNRPTNVPTILFP